jgi:hypothetical protein
MEKTIIDLNIKIGFKIKNLNPENQIKKSKNEELV